MMAAKMALSMGLLYNVMVKMVIIELFSRHFRVVMMPDQGREEEEDEDELQWGDYKVSPMTVHLKPTSIARIIMDLSYPHNSRLGKREVCLPNEVMPR